MRRVGLILAAMAGAVAGGSASADVGSTGGPLELSKLGLKNGSVVSMKCDVAAEATWLRGDVVAGVVRLGPWGAAIDTPSRWRIEAVAGAPTWFKLRALGQGDAPGPRYLSLRPKSVRNGPEPFLASTGDDVASSFRFYYLADQFGNVNFVGLTGISAKPHPQGQPAWVKCDPGSGGVIAAPSLDPGHAGAWRLYIEVPGR